MAGLIDWPFPRQPKCDSAPGLKLRFWTLPDFHRQLNGLSRSRQLLKLVLKQEANLAKVTIMQVLGSSPCSLKDSLGCRKTAARGRLIRVKCLLCLCHAHAPAHIHIHVAGSARRGGAARRVGRSPRLCPSTRESPKSSRPVCCGQI